MNTAQKELVAGKLKIQSLDKQILKNMAAAEKGTKMQKFGLNEIISLQSRNRAAIMQTAEAQKQIGTENYKAVDTDKLRAQAAEKRAKIAFDC